MAPRHLAILLKLSKTFGVGVSVNFSQQQSKTALSLDHAGLLYRLPVTADIIGIYLYRDGLKGGP